MDSLFSETDKPSHEAATVDDWLLEALSLEGRERDAFMERLSRRHPEAATEVSSMLSAYQKFETRFLADDLGGAIAEVTVRPTRDEDLTETVDLTVPSDKPSRIGPYLILEELGRGSNGRVFRARQNHPSREVALKLMPGLGEALDPPRYHREYQALARMRHPNIAVIYDAGTTPVGEAWIAMELLEGHNLRDYCRINRPTPQQRLELFLQLLNGIIHAHQNAVVHRDLKPANLMVTEVDGKPCLKIIDFGLAKGIDTDLAGNAMQTGFGDILGTPIYMSPEQLVYGSPPADIRSDVFSLGLIGHELICGRHPYDLAPMEGMPLDELFSYLRTAEPLTQPTDTRGKRLDKDLACVLGKAMERDINQRYQSAYQLKVDVAHFLAGEPVSARPSGWWYRLGKRVARNKKAYTLGFLALSAVLSAFAWAGYNHLIEQQRRRLIQNFSERAALLEAEARLNALSPLHDVRPDLRRLRLEMDRIEEEIALLGNLAEGPGHYALGRGHRVLGDLETAQAHLRDAWASGFQDGRVAYEMALVSGNLYRRERRRVLLIKDEKQRRLERNRLETTHRQPLLDWLRLAEGAHHPQYPSALMAYFEERYPQALEIVSAMKTRPWFYEHHLLAGDICKEQALEAHTRGDYAEADAWIKRGRQALDQAVAVSKASPEVYRAFTDLHLVAMIIGMYHDGEVVAPFKDAEQALDLARRCNPDDWETLLLENRVARRFAEYHKNRGGEAFTHIIRAEAAVVRLLEIKPNDPGVLCEAGRTWRQYAEICNVHARDPRPFLEKARNAFAQIELDARDYRSFNDLGLVYLAWGQYETQRGGRALHHWQAAADAFLSATRIAPKMAGAWINRGQAKKQEAACYDDAREKTALFAAVSALKKALDLNPNSYPVHYNLGDVFQELAEYHKRNGKTYMGYYEQALGALEKARLLDPNRPEAIHTMATLNHLLAGSTWERGGDPYPLLDQAQKLEQSLIDRLPGIAAFHNNLGDFLLTRARYLRLAGNDPRPVLERAEAGLAKAAELAPNHQVPQEGLATAQLEHAQYLLNRGLAVGGLLERAGVYLALAKKLNPNSAEVHLLLAEKALLEAHLFVLEQAAPEGRLEVADNGIKKALVLEPDNPKAHLALARIMYWKRRYLPPPHPGSWSDQALTAAAAAAKRGLSEGLYWEAVFLQRAVAEVSSSKRQEAQNKARAKRVLALETNGHLAPTFASLLPP